MSDSGSDDEDDDEIKQDYDEYIFDQLQHSIDSVDDFKLPDMIRDDYFDYINSETIGCLCDLDGVADEILESLAYDHNHMDSPSSPQCFLEITNKFITYLVERKADWLEEYVEESIQDEDDIDDEFY
jgi:hypothetical protein